MEKLKGLYAITDEKLTPYKDGLIFEKVEKALKGGAKVLQLRDKTNEDNFIFPYAIVLRKLCKNYGALFIINDRVELAKKVEADGVHLGEEDCSIEEARRILGSNKIIGISCYGDLERAKLMEENSANYVAFGSFFVSPTKPTSKVIDKKILIEAKKVLKIPICAIGGITAERAKELVRLGADLIAVVSDLWLAKDVEKRAAEYQKIFKDFKV